MWLDRFSSNNTPSGSLPLPPPQNRSYSPAPPRRPSHLTPGTSRRPSYSPRASSPHSGVANASTTSLNFTRIPNGSTLKQQITQSELVDPLQILAEVVGKPLVKYELENGSKKGLEEFKRPAHLVEHVDFNGLSLQEFTLAFDRNNEGKAASFVLKEQTVEECEYVYTVDNVENWDLNHGVR